VKQTDEDIKDYLIRKMKSIIPDVITYQNELIIFCYGHKDNPFGSITILKEKRGINFEIRFQSVIKLPFIPEEYQQYISLKTEKPVVSKKYQRKVYFISDALGVDYFIEKVLPIAFDDIKSELELRLNKLRTPKVK
jgi:hypothetical protein